MIIVELLGAGLFVFCGFLNFWAYKQITWTLQEMKSDQRQLLTLQMEKELFPEIKQITPTRKKIQSYALLGREVYRREEQ